MCHSHPAPDSRQRFSGKPGHSLWLAGLIAATLFFGGTPAQAWFGPFFVTNGAGTKLGQVFEQIFPAPAEGLPAALGFDYEFTLANIAPGTAIDGFDVFTGVPAVPLQVNTVPPGSESTLSSSP